MGFEALAADLQKAAFLYGLLELAALGVIFWIAYLVTKAAVRDGINASHLGKRLSREPTLYERSRKNIEPRGW